MKLCKESRKNLNFQMALKEKCVLPYKEVSKIDLVSIGLNDLMPVGKC